MLLLSKLHEISAFIHSQMKGHLVQWQEPKSQMIEFCVLLWKGWFTNLLLSIWQSQLAQLSWEKALMWKQQTHSWLRGWGRQERGVFSLNFQILIFHFHTWSCLLCFIYPVWNISTWSWFYWLGYFCWLYHPSSAGTENGSFTAKPMSCYCLWTRSIKSSHGQQWSSAFSRGKTTQKSMQTSKAICHIRRKKPSIRTNGVLWISLGGYQQC